ncbi:MAG: flagellar filament capping protein FliD [Candidatus Omnitrophica bacterium]|nr:flagellar filament capping protein FliD [Candidatus Omnitrophota bacterium]
MDLGISGLASGFDWLSLVDQLADVERAPQKELRSEQDLIQQRNNALSSVKTQLGVLKSRAESLKDPALFDSRIAASSDSSVATAIAAAGTALGTYRFNVTQLATAAVRQGTDDAGGQLSATNDVSGLVLSAASFSTPITAGTFTVNGKQISIATSDTLQAVFDKIKAATGNAVIARYDSATDKVVLSSAGEIVLGSATDSSNFIHAAKLYNNGTGDVASDCALGAIKLSGPINQANFADPISDGGSGAGEFKINGVSISFNTGTDSVANVISRINDSATGVTAGYDAVNDRFTLTNKNSGDIGIALEDVTGNFLAATGLSGGTLQRGLNLQYTLNDSGILSSSSNTITEISSGLEGLSVNVSAEGSFTITVGADTEKIKAAITDFVTQYNQAQSLLSTQTASSTDSTGKVTAGTLAGDPDANDLISRLRNLVTSDVTSVSGSLLRLDSLGFSSNGNDDTLSTSDTSGLDSTLSDNLSDLKELFSSPSRGLAVRLDAYLENTIGDNGSLVTHQNNLTRQSTNIDAQIADMEKVVLANRELLIEKFTAMEDAQSKINQQLQFLQQQFA